MRTTTKKHPIVVLTKFKPKKKKHAGNTKYPHDTRMARFSFCSRNFKEHFPLPYDFISRFIHCSGILVLCWVGKSQLT